MSTQAESIPYTPDHAPASRRERLLALSGIGFIPLFLVGWFASASTTPHYAAADQAWVTWAHDNVWKGRISSFAMLLACFLFLTFIGGMRDAFAHSSRDARKLASVAFAGGITGIAGMSTAIVIIGAAATNGADVNPTVSKAVATAAAGPFLVAAAGFAAFLMASGILTFQTVALARWVGVVALAGSVCFLITSLTVLGGTTNGSVFGYAFFPALLSLVVWTAAASVNRYRTASV